MSVYRLKLVDCITCLFSCKLHINGACNCVCVCECVCHSLIVFAVLQKCGLLLFHLRTCACVSVVSESFDCTVCSSSKQPLLLLQTVVHAEQLSRPRTRGGVASWGCAVIKQSAVIFTSHEQKLQ